MSNVALTTFQQLGGNRFTLMTGAQVMSDGDALRINLPRGAKDGINLVTIALDASDTYNIVWSKFRGLKVTNLRTDEMVYADQLRELFESVTGLRVSL